MNANSTDPTSPEGAFQHFLTMAPPVDSGAVLTFRSDPHLAQHNILRGLEAVLEQQQRIAQELPFVEIDRLREKVVQAHMSSLRGAAAKDCADESGKRFRISVATMTRRRWRRPSPARSSRR
jgi:hypothetical protein